MTAFVPPTLDVYTPDVGIPTITLDPTMESLYYGEL